MPVLVAGSELAEADPASTLACPVPAGTTAGEVLVAVVSAGHSGTVPDQPGWITIARTAAAGRAPTGMFGRAATAAEPASYTLDAGGSGNLSVSMHRLRGVDFADPLDALPQTVAQAPAYSITTPSITTATPGALLLYAITIQSSGDNSFITADDEATVLTYSLGVGRRQMVAAEDMPNPGVTGDRTWGITSQLSATAIVVAFRPNEVDAKFSASATLTYAITPGAVVPAQVHVGFALSADLSMGATIPVAASPTADLAASIIVNGQQVDATLPVAVDLAATAQGVATVALTLDASADARVVSVAGAVLTPALPVTVTATARIPVWRDITVHVGTYRERTVTATYRE